MISATRWVAADRKEGMQRKYLALYELETDDLEAFNAKVGERGRWTMKEGRFSDLPVFDPPNIPRCYKQIMPEKRPKSQTGKRKGDGK